MSIKLVVWDWNGTLFSDHKAVLEAANATEVPLLGLPPVTLKRMRETYEVPIINAYEKLGIPPEVFRARSAEISPLFHKHYEPLAAKARTRPGARNVLKKLKDQSTTCVILSNHTMEGIYFQLSRLKLEEFFIDVLANDDTNSSHHIGKQHRLESYLETNHYKPNEVVIVGDTPEEIHIGRALGIHTISICGGMCSKSRLVAAKPDKLIASVPQIINVVEEF